MGGGIQGREALGVRRVRQSCEVHEVRGGTRGRAARRTRRDRRGSQGRRSAVSLLAVLLVGGAVGAHVSAATASETTLRASVASASNGGGQGNDASLDPHVSADGRLVVFESEATNLVPSDTNAKVDIFVRDLDAETTERVSVSSSGAQANGDSGVDPILSGDGRYVAFPSKATNLVPGDTNGKQDLFLRDLVAGTTARVSLTAGGGQGNGASFDPYVSGNGRFVIFSSQATNMVPGDTNGDTDIFMRDTVAGTTERVSLTDSGGQANDKSEDAVVSDDGRYVAFSSLATNLVPGDTNGERDIFVRDVVAGRTRRVSVSSTGAQANGDSGYNPAISANGRYVAFNDDATNLVPQDHSGRRHVYVHDLVTGDTTLESVSSTGAPANASSTSAPSLSRDGRYVAFLSSGSNLVPGDTNKSRDVFLRDRVGTTTTRVSVAASGAESMGGEAFSQPYVSASGNVVVFTSSATNLVSGDTNGDYDIFVRTLTPPPPPDHTPPTVSIDSPEDAATVEGTVTVEVEADDDTGVARVELAVDGGQPGVDTAAPWQFSWDTTRIPDGEHTLVATAFDQAGNRTTSAPVTVEVDNPEPPPPPPAPEEITISPEADATVRADKPSTKYGTEPTIPTDGDPVKRALLRFPLSAVDGRTIEHAKLRLYNVGASKAGGDIRPLNATPWTESTVTWTNAPLPLDPVVASLAQVREGQWYEWDVTSLVQSANGTLGIALTSTSSDGAIYASREDTAHAPTLIVTAAPR